MQEYFRTLPKFGWPIAGLICLAQGPSAVVAATFEAAAPKPNIVYILADDLGYGEIGPYGQRIIQTPALDRLAREGMRFTDHYSGSTVCAPSRSSLMTGQHTGNTRIRNNFGTDPLSGEDVRVPLLEADVTVAEILKEAGYRTAIIGKWGLGLEDDEGHPLRQGFDKFFGFLNQKRAHNHYPDWIWNQYDKQLIPENADNKESVYVHDLFTREAMEFINEAEQDPRPFYLYLAYTLPHSDVKVPEDRQVTDGTPNGIFKAMVERLDMDIGRLQDRLAELGLDEDTLFIFTSDNGPHNQEGKETDYFRGSGPFRGIKRDVHEGGIRVPMIAKWSGVIPPDSISGHVSAFWDFLPTAAEVAGVEVPAAIDGISFLPALRGLPNPQHNYLYWEFVHKEQARVALRSGDWKLIRISGKPAELYYLPSDPREEDNLYDNYPQIVAKLEKLLADARSPSALYPLSTY